MHLNVVAVRVGTAFSLDVLVERFRQVVREIVGVFCQIIHTQLPDHSVHILVAIDLIGCRETRNELLAEIQRNRFIKFGGFKTDGPLTDCTEQTSPIFLHLLDGESFTTEEQLEPDFTLENQCHPTLHPYSS